MEWESGSWYEGEMMNDMPNGKGETMEEGYHYIGDFEDGAFHGAGTYVGGGQTYEGEFFGNARHGKGRLRWDDGTEKTCVWVQDECGGTERPKKLLQ